MFLSVNLVILLAGMFLPLKGLEENDAVESLNDHIDDVLRNLRKDASLKSKFDSIKIPNMSTANLQLSDIRVRGLSSLYRHGDCVLSGSEHALKITGEVGVRDISVTANYKSKVLFFWISGDVYAELDQVAIRFQLFAKETKLHLDSLKVIHLGNYRIKKITGFSILLNWLVKIILNTFSSLVRWRIIEVVEGPAADALRTQLQAMITSFSKL